MYGDTFKGRRTIIKAFKNQKAEQPEKARVRGMYIEMV